MVDELEEKPGEGINLEQYVDVIRRRHMYFLIPFFLGWLVVWSVSWVLPSRYKSGTLILVEQPSMPKDYVTPNVTDDLQARLQSITQQILSRTRLLHIIEELNLYADQRGRLNPDELVERMRKDIEIALVFDEHHTAITSFNIYYSSRDPHLAQQVTGELTNLFISENLELRQQKSEDTTKFLEQQLETARQNLAEQEEKVRIYKDQHLGELPSQLTSNVQILSGLQSQLQSEEDGLNADRQQNAYLQTMLQQSRALQRTTKTGESAPVGIPALDQELAKLKSQLADLSSHYTDRHPDVRKLKDQIAKTEKMREQALTDLKTAATTASASGNPPASVPEEMNSQDSSAAIQLQGQLKSNQIDIANKEHEIAALKSKINDYQARLNQEPVREQQFADLTRGYEQSKANYDELLKKKNSSQMATSMELLQQGEHFQMIDPPSLPLKPDFPNRLKFCGIGLGIGIALGIVLAGGTEYLDDRLYSEKALKDLLPVNVISEIPAITGPDEARKQERKLWVGWAAAGLVFATILAGSAISYLRG
jgi:polysaccharide chain length determinant protein (PEP-CTERM system associated)